MSILSEGTMRPFATSRSKVRLVCNAAGGLLPALAIQLRDTFKCIVLPSYGMTECMPISTPPLDYTLSRSGTSGIACGPQVSILDENDNAVAPGEVGRINVRGGPIFDGYLVNGKIDKSAFNKDGWFDTGDLGSLDDDRYLYLTGRGKEVINRGGELISPFEVEEAITLASQLATSPLYKRVTQVMAFPAAHHLLQEVVGVALVTPPGQPRPDLRELHTALKASLHSSALPVVLVYIDALPTSNNKIVRIKCSARLELEAITAETTLSERHFNAVCPPVNSPLTTKIPKTACVNDLQLVMRTAEEFIGPELETYVGVSHHDGTPEIYLAHKEQPIESEKWSPEGVIDSLRSAIKTKLDGFLHPSRITYLPTPFPRLSSGVVDEAALHTALKKPQGSDSSLSSSQTEHQIRRAFSEVLSFDIEDISSSSDFFELGGDSLSAGRLLSILRRDMQIRIPVDKLFGSSRVCDLCLLADELLQLESRSTDEEERPLPGCTETYSSTHPLILFIQLLPLVVFYPMKMALQWTTLMYALSTIGKYWSEPNIPARFVALIGAMFISRFCIQVIAPVIGILFKMAVMGKYKEGMYPMWGPYHTRWWLTQKVLTICGKVRSSTS